MSVHIDDDSGNYFIACDELRCDEVDVWVTDPDYLLQFNTLMNYARGEGWVFFQMGTTGDMQKDAIHVCRECSKIKSPDRRYKRSVLEKIGLDLRADYEFN